MMESNREEVSWPQSRQHVSEIRRRAFPFGFFNADLVPSNTTSHRDSPYNQKDIFHPIAMPNRIGARICVLYKRVYDRLFESQRAFHNTRFKLALKHEKYFIKISS